MEVIMSFTITIKTLFLSGLFIGSSFASRPAPSPYTKVTEDTATVSASALAAAQSSSSAPQLCSVPFKVTAQGGVTFPCEKAVNPSVQEDVMIRAIVEKIEKGTLHQHDDLLKKLIPGFASMAQECDCQFFKRTNGCRNYFENELLKCCKKSFGQNQQSFSYVNFSSGLLFQDLIIATRLLLAGHKNITINLVDGYYKEFISYACNAEAVPVHALRPMAENSDVAKVCNAVCFLSRYFSLLQAVIPDCSVKITMYDATQTALKSIEAQSVNLIFCVDFGAPEGFPEEKKQGNPFLDYFQDPDSDYPHKIYKEADEEKGNGPRDFFILAQHTLKEHGVHAIARVIEIREKKMSKIMFATHFTLPGNIPAYCLSDPDSERFKLVFENRYRIYMRGNKIEYTDLWRSLYSDDLVDEGKYPFVRQILEEGIAKLSAQNSQQLSQLVTEIKQKYA